MLNSSLSALLQATAPDFVRQGTIVASGAIARAEECIGRCGETFAKSSANPNINVSLPIAPFRSIRRGARGPTATWCDYDEDYDTAVAVELLPCKIPELR
jgi:hypothetical protein